jgi:hypothetical protein
MQFPIAGAIIFQLHCAGPAARAQVYRNVFQAYGRYVAPVGKALAVDFGKWASALGPEGNYTKDQVNDSRSYCFAFLPFYHMGLRVTYPVNDRLSVAYWLVNGANQTEDFNGPKSQLAQAVVKPAKNLTWTLNYYNGREQRDLAPALNPGLPAIPSQPGLSTTPVIPAPRRRLPIIDTYAFWNATDKLRLGGEFDYAISRVESNSAPQRVTGGRRRAGDAPGHVHARLAVVVRGQDGRLVSGSDGPLGD